MQSLIRIDVIILCGLLGMLYL